MNTFWKEMEVRWSDLDANNHVRNTAYSEFAIQTRFSFFAAHGFPVEEFKKQRFGPVILKEEVVYLKELHFLESFKVNFLKVGMNESCARFIIRNEIYKTDESLAASVTTQGAWFHLETRKLMPPPPPLLRLMINLPESEDYAPLQ